MNAFTACIIQPISIKANAQSDILMDFEKDLLCPAAEGSTQSGYVKRITCATTLPSLLSLELMERKKICSGV